MVPLSSCPVRVQPESDQVADSTTNRLILLCSVSFLNCFVVAKVLWMFLLQRVYY